MKRNQVSLRGAFRSLKRYFALLFILANSAAQAQCLSLKELLIFAETGFDTPDKLLRSKGFVGVRWRHDDPDIDGRPGASKAYSKTANAYLIFRPDGHGRTLEQLTYRQRSSACVVLLKKQLLAAHFTDNRQDLPPPPEDSYNFVHPLSPYDGSFSNAQYTIKISGEVDEAGKDLYRYTVTINRDAAVKEMNDIISRIMDDVVNRTNHPPKLPASPTLRKKSH